MPFVEKEQYQIPIRCRLHPANDLYRDQEEHKLQEDINEWRCGYCKKEFYDEKYLDKHLDNRHFDLLNVVRVFSFLKNYMDWCQQNFLALHFFTWFSVAFASLYNNL